MIDAPDDAPDEIPEIVCALIPLVTDEKKWLDRNVIRYLTTSARGRPDDLELPGGMVRSGENPRFTLAKKLRRDTGLLVRPETLSPIGRLGQSGNVDGSGVWRMTIFRVLPSVAESELETLRFASPYELEPGVVVRFSTAQELVSKACRLRHWHAKLMNAVES